MKVAKGQKVKLHYTGTLDDGTVFDSSKDKDPLEFIAGSGMVIKGFDDAVIGMEVGASKKFSIESKEAYGPVIKDLVQEVPKEAFGEEAPEVGLTIGIKAPTGQVLPAKIVEVKGDKVTLDLNHPLAGKRLTFDINIVESKNLTKKEQEDLEKAQSEHHHHHEHGESCGHDHGHKHDKHDCGGGCC